MPWIECEQGVLFGEVRWAADSVGRMFVLSDPDLLATHTLGRSRNAELAVALMDAAREETRSIVFDETLHGHTAPPTIWRELFSFPLVLVLIQVAIVAAVLLWAAIGRFGAPLPAELSVRSGKETLIRNTADLLQTGGHSARVLDRYFQATIREVIEGYRIGAKGSDEALETAARLSKARETTFDPNDLGRAVRDERRRRKVHGPGVVRAAMRIHHWKEEVLHGSG